MKNFRISFILFVSLVIVSLSFQSCGGAAEKGSSGIKNLRAFAKLFGYVKYFHPSDEAAKIDWDKFAIYGSDKVKSAANSEELKTTLEELFQPIAPTFQLYRSGEQPEDPKKDLPEDTSGLKVVAWQHKGVGLGTSSAYMSIRINRENKISSGGGAGVLTQHLDAALYRGKEVKLTASVRTNFIGSGNKGLLWMRVDREDKKIGFFDNMSNRPITSKEWNEYEIKGEIAEDAVSIDFGCILVGQGQLWLDDFRIMVKTGENDWEPVPIKNPGFEMGEAGKQPELWFSRSPETIYSLITEDPLKGKMSLMMESISKTFSGKIFDRYPEPGEVVNKKLTDDLFCRVPLALYSDENTTLGKNEKYPFEKFESELDAFNLSIATADHESIRLGVVVIAWNVFQHFYPYFDEVEVNWDKVLTDTLNEALEDETEKDFFYSLSGMIAKLKDGHGNVFHSVQREQEGLPFKVEWIENQVVITVSKDQDNFKRGDVIVSIDGKNAEQALLDSEKFISGSTQWRRYKSLNRFGYGEKGSVAKLKIKRDGSIVDKEVERNFQGNLFEPKRPKIDKLEDDILYVDLDRAVWDEINGKINEIADAIGVVFDLRGYPKGNHWIIGHLLKEKDTSDSWMQFTQIIYPDQENIAGFLKSGWNIPLREPHINGKVVFICDGRSISYAESFMSFIKHYKLAEIVGQPTAGANGNVNPLNLPGGFRVTWTGMKVVKHDGSQHHTIGVLPTVPYTRTIKGVIDGRDELLEKALEIIKQ